ncbi:pyridoxamine 5'-phosphate oxidase family protein [Rhodococcus sp. NPDC127528]|uniref:pyridoxamine 5'-phosphate oxidase family protein n=1 Tax=unclassified Rhodococcus (in: high G+C Gram-positive bacteria) TaxID=192944 RepID=UPI00363EC162
MPVTWSDDVDAILGGDITCGLACLTPAGGAVVTTVSPIGLRDREHGTVGFTTSLGFGRKLERIKDNPRVALAYHAREHGVGDCADPRFVLVQGEARFDPHPDRATLDEIGEHSEPYLGAPRRGPFWDRWLRAYYEDRVLVTVTATRVVAWPSATAEGEPEVFGAPRPDGAAAPQTPPKKGTGPRVHAVRTGDRASRLPHLLLAYRDADRYPVIVPVGVRSADAAGVRLRVPAGVPLGGRRAGLLAHSYGAQLVGLESRQNTGWLEVTDNGALYAPHTESGFRAPANKTILLLANGFLARRGLAKARRQGRVQALG